MICAGHGDHGRQGESMNTAGRSRRGQPSSGPASTLDPGGSAAAANVAPGSDASAAGTAAASAAGTAADSLAAPAQASRRPRLRALAARPAARHVALLAIYLAAGIAVTWPRGTYLFEGKVPASSDVSSYIWDLWWVARQVTHLGNPWFTHYMAAPAGIQLGFDTTMPLAGLLMTPITLAFGPSAAFSLLTIVTPGLLCYAMYRAARLWVAPVGAIAAGALFGLASMLMWQNWYHLNIAVGTIFLPLALEATIRLRRAPSRRRGVILGLILGASVLVNQESAVLAVILAVLILAPWLISALARDRAALRARIISLALGAVVALVVAAPQLVAMAQQVRTGGVSAGPETTGPALLTTTYGMYGADLPALLGPSPRLASYGLNGLASAYHYQQPSEGLPTFGLVLGVLALLGLAIRWRRLNAWWFALLWLGSAALALGTTLFVGRPVIGPDGLLDCPARTCHHYVPLATTWNGVRVSQLMPYTWLVRIPGLSALREADRLALIGLVGAAVLAGIAVDWISRRARPLLIAVLVLGVLEAGWSGIPGPGTMPAALPALDRAIAADHSGSVVLDVPYGLRGGIPLYGSRISPAALLVASADGHPRAVSYTSWVPAPTIEAVSKQAFFIRLGAAEHGHHSTAAQLIAAQRSLRSLHIGWVLVWLHIWKTRQPQSRYQSVELYLEQTGFRVAYQADGVMVFRPAPR
jgi:hypothetical protein